MKKKVRIRKNSPIDWVIRFAIVFGFIAIMSLPSTIERFMGW